MAYLRRARAGLDRLTPAQAHREQRDGALLIDVRMPAHRAEQGEIPWRLDPSFDWRIPEATGWDNRYILVCRHSYSSSVAAWQLRQMGLTGATDVIGGFEAWAAAGLPVGSGPADVRD